MKVQLNWKESSYSKLPELQDVYKRQEWYGAVPTPGDMELLARQIETFCALYEQDPRQEMCGMGY